MSNLIDLRVKVQDRRYPGGHYRGSKEVREAKRAGKKGEDRKQGRKYEGRESRKEGKKTGRRALW